MIKERTERFGWEFIFVAANIDAIETADNIGIRRERAANYRQSRDGYVECYEAMDTFVTMTRRAVPRDEIDRNWKRRLDGEEHE